MLKIYNTLSQKKEVFKPLKKGRVGIYTCGPTVYDYAHIGNFRSYIVADTIRRYLEYLGYKVKHVKNITDVGHLTEDDLLQDKILLAAKKERKKPQAIAKFYTKAFLEDEKKLNIKRADVYPRATKHIKEMQNLIKILIKKKYAYEIPFGIYYNVPKFKNYGKLSGKKLGELKVGARLEPVPGKKSPFDFALWVKDPKHLMRWYSPWGTGYPGWHIECSAMSMKYLGKTFDIHTGGEDNIFPHHENEIAQSEVATGKKFVKYWIHTRFLLVGGEKMSKSKGNFYTFRDLEEKGYSSFAFRFLILNSHHRTQLNFTFKGLKQAEANLSRIYEFVGKLEELKDKKGFTATPKSFTGGGLDAGRNAKALILKTQKDLEAAMDDDFNTPVALASVFYLINRGNWLFDRNRLTPKDAKDILKTLRKIDKVFGFIFLKRKKEKIPKNILKLAKEREGWRKKEIWKKADEIRKKIENLGYLIQDSKEGSKIKPR